jgi:TolB protein
LRRWKFLTLFVTLCAAQATAQKPQAGQDIRVTLFGPPVKKLALAVPDAGAAASPAVQAQVYDPYILTLRNDLQFSGAFDVVNPTLYPKGSRDIMAAPGIADRWIGTGAQELVDSRIDVAADRVTVEMRVYDLPTRKMVFGKRYAGGNTYVPRIAHTAANDIVKYFTGKSGIFLTSIAFASDRDTGPRDREIYVMDFDGRNVRRLTWHRSLSMNPAFSPDGSTIAYTTYAKTFPHIFLAARDGSAKRELRTTTELNASPSFSPDGKQIVFAGSVHGNQDIYAVNVDGTGLRRLTSSHAIEASPRWSPTGRQILYTSDQSGTPQLYVMDVEGTNSHRITFAGNWNDEGAWSPDGSKVAFACRNDAEFNICLMDLSTGQTLQLTQEGTASHPSFSPDGSKIAYASRKGGTWQVYVMAIDGTNKRALTDRGNNTQPSWSPLGP